MRECCVEFLDGPLAGRRVYLPDWQAEYEVRTYCPPVKIPTLIEAKFSQPVGLHVKKGRYSILPNNNAMRPKSALWEGWYA